MITSAIRHLSFYPFVQALARNRIQWRLEAAPGDLTACELVCWKRSEPEVLFRTSLLPGLEDGQRQQWTGETVFTGETHYIKYGFWLEDQAGNRRWLNDRGLFTDMQEAASSCCRSMRRISSPCLHGRRAAYTIKFFRSALPGAARPVQAWMTGTPRRHGITFWAAIWAVSSTESRIFRS